MSSPYDLLSPSDREGYVRVRQATKLGYIEVEVGGGWQTFRFQQVNFAEVVCKVAVKSALH